MVNVIFHCQKISKALVCILLYICINKNNYTESYVNLPEDISTSMHILQCVD